MIGTVTLDGDPVLHRVKDLEPSGAVSVLAVHVSHPDDGDRVWGGKRSARSTGLIGLVRRAT
ncbi:hypothetical protein ETD86_26125 [Nonomuraea turkmeniaca]|uniref:Uncharacterized protein n=1 Tax=Nonomuraea turkmeniaca TaxID=103838 RepID=A0A5S4FCX0_9ACTN|nr:hypothetical protein [Nonomuraea turkmeniaca]TMR15908.1 hypothetical protein ETD86_26125 [Nonomuraea turkmeniaca]